jgi:nicotinamide-nucleotide amidase
MNANELSLEIGELLKERGLWLGVVESATGGLISHYITNISGSSEYFQGSITTYSNDAKMKLAGVKRDTLEEFGAVSGQVAMEMADGGCKALGADICVSVTGIAGPTGATKDKPLGLFYLALSFKGNSVNRRYVFTGTREQNKEQAALVALSWIKEYLQDLVKKKKESIVFKVEPVVSVFLEANKRVLLLRRSAQEGFDQGPWGAVSGYIDAVPDRQALTEIKNQTGLSLKDVQLKNRGAVVEILDKKLKIKWEVHPYLFKVKDTSKLEFDREMQETRWVSPAELDQLSTVPKLKEALQSALESTKLKS